MKVKCCAGHCRVLTAGEAAEYLRWQAFNGAFGGIQYVTCGCNGCREVAYVCDENVPLTH